MLEDPPLVEKGKRVLIRAENELIRVTTLGKVLEEGRAGDQIQVMNIGSGKVVLATVVGPGTVEVVF
jgi:flagella basal body P-ring formation protein FlgA